jgi:hypothetical protein
MQVIADSDVLAHFEQLVARGEVSEVELKAVSTCDELLGALKLASAGQVVAAHESYAAAESVRDRTSAAMALVLRGELYLQCAEDGHDEETLSAARRTFDQVVRVYGRDRQASVRVQVAKALNGAARVHRVRAETGAELAAYREVIRRFGSATESPLRVQVARALIDEIVTERRFGRRERDTHAAEFIGRFGGAGEPQIREYVADLIKDEAIALAEEESWAMAIDASDRVLDYLGDENEDVGRRAIAYALLVKATALEELGRDSEAREVFTEIEERFRGERRGELCAIADDAKDHRRRLARPRVFRRAHHIGPVTITPPRIGASIEGPLGSWPRFGWALIAVGIIAGALRLPGGDAVQRALEANGQIAEAREYVDERLGAVALGVVVGALALWWLLQLGLLVLRGKRDHVTFLVVYPAFFVAYVALVAFVGWPSVVST